MELTDFHHSSHTNLFENTFHTTPSNDDENHAQTQKARLEKLLVSCGFHA